MLWAKLSIRTCYAEALVAAATYSFVKVEVSALVQVLVIFVNFMSSYILQSLELYVGCARC